LRDGSQRFIDAPADLLLFERSLAGQRLLCAFNLGSSAYVWRPSADHEWRMIESVGGAKEWNFPPRSGLIARCLT
jgi:alpha-glucosidase